MTEATQKDIQRLEQQMRDQAGVINTLFEMVKQHHITIQRLSAKVYDLEKSRGNIVDTL